MMVGTLRRTLRMPFSAPRALPTTSVSTTAGQIPAPSFAMSPKTTPLRPTTDPIDRSISPQMMT